MSYLNYTCELIETTDGGAKYTLTMNTVMYKCMKSIAVDPKEWINNAVSERSRIEGERIYKYELENHIENNTMPSNPTKETLILAYEIPTYTDVSTTHFSNTISTSNVVYA
jgi:hypothetical protein